MFTFTLCSQWDFSELQLQISNEKRTLRECLASIVFSIQECGAQTAASVLQITTHLHTYIWLTNITHSIIFKKWAPNL